MSSVSMGAHTGVIRLLRRRLPFGNYWWLPALWQLLVLVVTPLTLWIWLQPGGIQSTVGLALRWLWVAVLGGKIVFGLFTLLMVSIARSTAPQSGRSFPMRAYLLMVTAHIAGLALFATGGVEMALVVEFGAAALSTLLTRAKTGPRMAAARALLYVFVAAAVLARSPWAAWCLGTLVYLLDNATTLARDYRSLLRRDLRDALSGKPSRIEYGVSALEACPIGGG